MSADLRPDVRAEAVKAAEEILFAWSADVRHSDVLAAVDAVTAIVVPAALDLEERAHARTSAEVARLEAQELVLREQAGEMAEDRLRDAESLRQFAMRVDQLNAVSERLRTSLRAADADEDRRLRNRLGPLIRESAALSARVEVLTEALTGVVGALTSTGYPRRWDALDIARAALAAAPAPEEKNDA